MTHKSIKNFRTDNQHLRASQKDQPRTRIEKIKTNRANHEILQSSAETRKRQSGRICIFTTPIKLASAAITLIISRARSMAWMARDPAGTMGFGICIRVPCATFPRGVAKFRIKGWSGVGKSWRIRHVGGRSEVRGSFDGVFKRWSLVVVIIFWMDFVLKMGFFFWRI